jgi:hypothetical protein
MRKILLIVAFVVTMSILWMFGGRQLSMFVDQFKRIETASVPIKALVYEGNGTGGSLHINNDLGLNLTPADPKTASPNIGTTKDGQLALSFGGKVFAFGPPKSDTESLATAPQTGDDAAMSIQHSVLRWIEPLNFNFMTGKSPSWIRHQYYRLTWKKQAGAKLEMVWCYEQYFYPGDGWASGMMTREGSTGLIRVEISSPLPSPQSSP